MAGACRTGWLTTDLNEVQFPKKLRPRSGTQAALTTASLNEVQFPKEMRPEEPVARLQGWHASMKCSSRGNCDATNHVPVPKREVPQ